MKRARVARFFVRAGVALALAWALAVTGLLLARRSLIYPFRDNVSAAHPVGLPRARAVRVDAPDGVGLVGWLVEPHPGLPLIVHFPGNAGSLPHSASRLAEFAYRGYGIAALNYRGAGGLPGEPSEAALTADALAFYDALGEITGTAPAERVIYGTSLGAAVAVQVAARREARGLVLETPFARLCETAEAHFAFAPACTLMWDDRWDSIDRIGSVGMPLLVLHGDRDATIPVAQGRRLFDAAAEPKRLIVYPGGAHNDLRLFGAGIDAMDWIEALAAGRP